jgi:hypothetical protein
MSDKTRFDPLDWFASVCLTVLLGAVALTIAAHLMQQVWPWLVATAVMVALVRLAIWWHRRRTW